MNDINGMSFSVSNNISELVNTINKNIYNFQKIVHKLQQNYKTNKLAIMNLSTDIKYLADNNQTDENEKIIDYVEIKIKDIKNNIQKDIEDIKNDIEKKQIENNKIINEKLIYYIGINIITSSVICLAFSKIY